MDHYAEDLCSMTSDEYDEACRLLRLLSPVPQYSQLWTSAVRAYVRVRAMPTASAVVVTTAKAALFVAANLLFVQVRPSLNLGRLSSREAALVRRLLGAPYASPGGASGASSSSSSLPPSLSRLSQAAAAA